MNPPGRRRRRGYTLVEGLFAALLLAVAITGMFSLYTVCYISIQHAGEINEAGQLARQELERIKVYGAGPSGSGPNFPEGTYSSGSGTATWTGAFDSSSGTWVSGGTAYYNLSGARVASSSATGAYFSLQITVTDRSVFANSTGTLYDIDVTSRRDALVTVKRLSDSTTVYQSFTSLTIGGL